MKDVIRLSRPYQGGFREGEELRIIDPASMTFLYSMGSGECHLRARGTCSLEGQRPPKGKDAEGEAGYDFCRNLLKSMMKNGMHSMMLIDVAGCGCGHYEFNDGQHRTCIAQRKGIKVEALVNIGAEACDLCAGSPDEDDELR